ncbi:hypothetical protein QU38_00725, partial [Staphylococcus aureus]
GIMRRLALQIVIARFVPRLDLRFQIVEDIVAPVGAHGQNRMAFAIHLAHDGDQQRADGQAALHQHPALEQHVVFAVADIADLVGIAPIFLDAVDFHVRGRLDIRVDLGVDLNQLRPDFWRQGHRRVADAADAAFV